MRNVTKVACVGRWLFVAVTLGAVLPSAGQAQLGGLRKLKAKVEQAVGDKPAAEASPQPSSPYNENTLEITPAVAECFERALAAENAELDAFKSWASKVKTQAGYEACDGEVAMSAAARAIGAEMVAATEKGQEAMQVMKTASEKMAALTEKTCGPKPSSAEQKRRDAVQAAKAKGMAVCGYTESQYNILKERVTPICKSGVLAGADGALKVPGDTNGMFYVYSAAEVAVFKARCAALMSALQKQL